MATSKKRQIKPTALLVMTAAAALAVCIYTYTNHFNGPPIRSDGLGYYAYLPAIFIHHDIFFTFIDRSAMWPDLARYPLEDPAFLGLKEAANGYVQKYPVGAAVLQAPFFFLAWLIASFISSNVSGFEASFQYANTASGIFYLCFGTWLLFLTMEKVAGHAWAVVLVVIGVFGTNTLLYGSYDASFSHVYCFFAASLAVFLMLRARPNLHPILFYFLMGATIGLATIIRPTNLIWVIILFISPPRQFRELVVACIAFASGFMLLAVPQLAYWFLTTGQVVTYSYQQEGFNFLSPELWNYLFSVRKGLFFWHPVYLVLVIGTVVAVYRKHYAALAFLGIFAISCYVNASWWSWWFGGSFGARPAVDVLPFLIAGTGLALAGIRPTAQGLVVASLATVALVLPNLIQMHGYIVGTIPFDGMTREGYEAFWRPIMGLL